MIRYALRCENHHDFDGWFRSSDGFDALRAEGQVSCTICGSTVVEKTLMAPGIAGAGQGADLQAPRDERETMLGRLREHIEKNSEYVGMSFAAEARAMHDGDRPERAIHGVAHPDEARKLIEDGIPVAPLPFIPRQRAN
ncbi:DUF1178 family protein [Paracoccus sp. DMF-8]|uniref:DUF1178 family protein n=1 Tax=Paracoccus sp. DMF-8 TaxID=3019445 RepID=UPI0023E78276|nr:DUF1178 family protein [Paracoccus sp. DMF-8]MDF3606982.1 DUF1178 family protein [Paracoccus sp. DMF-8]